MLVDHDFVLSLKFGLLCRVRLSVAIDHGRHVLDNKQTHLVASLVEQSRLDFDLDCIAISVPDSS